MCIDLSVLLVRGYDYVVQTLRAVLDNFLAFLCPKYDGLTMVTDVYGCQMSYSTMTFNLIQVRRRRDQNVLRVIWRYEETRRPSCASCFQAKCSGLSKDVLNNIYNSFDTWFCLTCSLPPFSDSFFDSSISSTNDSIVKNSLVMNNNEDPDIWKILSQDSAKHCVIGSFNINSLGNKFSEVMEWIQAFDILTIQETKLDKSFPDSQFAIDG